jgi:hypothetical protein
MPAKTFRLKIVRGDQHFEAEGDKAFVLQMLARFEGTAPAVTVQETPKTTKSGKVTVQASLNVAKGVSPGEFIRQFQFKKHTDIALAFGYFLEQHSALPSFTAADINNCYYEAKMESSNTSQSLINNIRRGFLMEAKNSKGAKRSYTVTRSGEEFLKQAITKAKEA